VPVKHKRLGACWGTIRVGRYAHAVLAIVPVKDLGGAKTRLAPILSDEARTRLVLEMLDRVLAACEEANAIGRTLLVTPDPSLARTGVDVLVDEGRGHAEAVALALADERAAEGALVVMADCPLVTAESLDALAAAARPFALAPARDGGVNALALETVNGFRPRFGMPAEAMLEAGRAAGLDAVVVHDPALALDVDRPEDYELLLASR
jgi:2-phospho-L-lactate/phosphoenolpyruvate guanylyltransferase